MRRSAACREACSYRTKHSRAALVVERLIEGVDTLASVDLDIVQPDELEGGSAESWAQQFGCSASLKNAGGGHTEYTVTGPLDKLAKLVLDYSKGDEEQAESIFDRAADAKAGRRP